MGPALDIKINSAFLYPRARQGQVGKIKICLTFEANICPEMPYKAKKTRRILQACQMFWLLAMDVLCLFSTNISCFIEKIVSFFLIRESNYLK